VTCMCYLSERYLVTISPVPNLKPHPTFCGRTWANANTDFAQEKGVPDIPASWPVQNGR